MGLFDFLSRKSNSTPSGTKGVSERELARLARLAGNKMAQNYDRQEAIEALTALKTQEAARALLRRFDFTMEPSIVDHEEKEAAAAGIVAAGEEALPAIRAYCGRAESLTWPLRVLREVVGEERMGGELVGLLEAFDTEYTRNSEPKIQLLGILAEFPSAEARAVAEPFLTDVNESVRFTAVGTVFTMADSASLPPLVEALAEEESLRIKNRIAQGLQERAWPLASEALLAQCQEALPPGYRVEGQRVQGGH